MKEIIFGLEGQKRIFTPDCRMPWQLGFFIFGAFKTALQKIFQDRGPRRAQASLEYFILLALVAILTLIFLGTQGSGFLDRVKNVLQKNTAGAKAGYLSVIFNKIDGF